MQRKTGIEGSIRKALRCKESTTLKARSEKRYGAMRGRHCRFDQKSVTVQRSNNIETWMLCDVVSTITLTKIPNIKKQAKGNQEQPESLTRTWFLTHKP